MANDRNIRYCQIFGTTSPFFRKINNMAKTKRTQSSATAKTSKETIKKTTFTTL